jgi:hypothetical protein
VYPRKHGGNDRWANLVTACQQCNGGKHARPLEPGQHVLTWDDWCNAERQLWDEAVYCFRSALDALTMDWLDWTGELVDPNECYAIGKLLLVNSYEEIQRAMRLSADRNGYRAEVLDHEGGTLMDANYGRIDLREVRQSIARWRRERKVVLD